MRLFRRALETIQANRRAYLVLNVIFYGSVLAGFGAGLMFPGLAAAQTESFEAGGTADLVRSLLGNPWLFALVILANNALRAGLLNLVLPSMLTVVMEIQAYVLLSLGAYLLGRAWIWPRTVGAENRRQAYLQGVRQLGVLSLPALVLLVVFALYESFSIIHLVPLLTEG